MEVGATELRELTVVELVALVATIVTIVGMLIGLFRFVVPLVRKLSDLTDDWQGEAARPGVPERPGVMERLARQDELLEDLTTRLGGGESIPNQLHALDLKVNANTGRVKAVDRLLRKHIRESEAWIKEVTDSAKEHDVAVPPWPHIEDDGHEHGPLHHD